MYFPARRRLGGSCHVREDDHHRASQLIGFGQLLYGEVYHLGSAIGPHLHAPYADGVFPAERGREGGSELVSKSLTRHREDVHIGLASRGLQVLPRFTADINDVSFIIGKHHGW